ncbi:MAG: hypothetical protein ACOY3E_12050 [Pseudomonadota bacterium]
MAVEQDLALVAQAVAVMRRLCPKIGRDGVVSLMGRSATVRARQLNRGRGVHFNFGLAARLGLFGLLALAAAGQAAEYRCQGRIKQHCSSDGCVSETEGFQHAEQFFYHSDGPALGACLWTVCYSGMAQRHVAADDGQTVIVGQLTPEHSPELYAPMLITLTLAANRQFTATWQHQGGAVVVTHGQCEPLPASS